MKRTKELIHELKHHGPFTAIATLIAVFLVIILQNILTKNVSEQTFNILHPVHIIVSGIASAAIFYKYKKNVSQALMVGVLGSILIGTLSDVIVPFIGGTLFTLQTEFHLPIVEKPIIILSSALIGSFLGISTGMTKLPHFTHVFLSVFASLFYLLAFSASFSLIYFLGAFLIVFIAVVIPCCMSDIVFPFFFLGQKIKTCNC